jgi:hypothetical protein
MPRNWIPTALASLALTILGLAQFANAGDDCCDTGSKVKKTCRAEVEVKKKAVYHYDCKDVDFCVPKCKFSFGGLFKKKKCGDECGECDSCDQGGCQECGRVRTKTVLLKKVRYEDECKTKCVVEECCEPVCAPVICAPAPCATETCAPACERAPLFQKKQKFCCPDYSNPYAGTALDPHAVPAAPAGKVPEPLPAPKKEEKPEPKGAVQAQPSLMPPIDAQQ